VARRCPWKFILMQLNSNSLLCVLSSWSGHCKSFGCCQRRAEAVICLLKGISLFISHLSSSHSLQIAAIVLRLQQNCDLPFTESHLHSLPLDRSPPDMSRRKHVLQKVLQEEVEPPGDGQRIVRAVGSRGSNIIEASFSYSFAGKLPSVHILECYDGLP